MPGVHKRFFGDEIYVATAADARGAENRCARALHDIERLDLGLVLDGMAERVRSMYDGFSDG